MEEEQPNTERNSEASTSGSSAKPMVVGIGASAGGLATLKRFFEHIPPQSGLAFVVVVHLSPEHKSHLPDLLQPSVKFPVQQVTETVPLHADNVYVIPPNANLSAIDTHLRLSKLEEHRRERAPIDHFFRTLASTHDGHSIGVILTGTGSDGTLGLKEIKAKGGLILVQDPNEAEFDGMPQSAIATGLVDRVLPINEIAAALLRLVELGPRIISTERENGSEQSNRPLVPKILAILKARTDRDFSRYKTATIMRRISRRMQLNYIDNLERYVERLRDQPEEARALADDLLITVTSFFRDPEVFKRLEREIVPKLFEGKGSDDIVRVWSVGCATGEEAYSVAMLLLEEAVRRPDPPRIQIFASDMHKRSLDGAREGLYPGDIETDVSPERLQRFFHKENGGYRICKEVRDTVVFAPHNLLGDPPFSRLDLITCRNLLIYLDRAVQRDVIDLFHYALCPRGYLLLGSAETIDASELFRTEDKKLCFYQKRNVPAPEPRLPVFPLTHLRVTGERPSRIENGTATVAYHSLHQNLLERYAPPSILVGPDNKLMHLSEHAGRYLVHPGGEVTSSVLLLVREELRIELQALLQSARENRRAADSSPITVRFNGHKAPVVMHVRAAQDADEDGFVLVIFDEHQPKDTVAIGSEAPSAVPSRPDGKQIAELEAELYAARQHLHAVIEEYETTQEEMKASNEEMQSTNEELRSTMEELETSKEELQSINEELQTVNQENRHKVEELSQLSSDLQNLLSATEIATLFLDRDLRIMRFTPRLAELFNVRVTDRGRPISDLTHRLGYGQLRQDAQTVLDRLIPIEREIRDDAGRWYLTRVLPYRSTEDRIEGVVITFIEITSRKLAEAALRESEGRFRALVTAGSHPVYRMSPDWQKMYQLDGHDLLADTTEPSEDWISSYILPEDRPMVLAAIEEAIRTKSLFELEHRVRRADGGTAWVLSRAVPMMGPDGEISEWFGAGLDISVRKEAEAALRATEERHRADLELQVMERTKELQESRDLLQATMDSSMAMIQVFESVRNEKGAIVDFRWLLNNHASEGQYGDVLGQSLLEKSPGVLEEGIFDNFKRVVETGEPMQSEHHYVHEQFDGWFYQSIVKLGDGIATMTTEITERKQAQEEVLRLRDEIAQEKLRESEAKYRQLVDFIPAAVYACLADGTLAYCNARAVELWGKEPDGREKAGTESSFVRILLPDGTPIKPEDSPMATVLATGQPVTNRELRLERPDGSTIDIQVNITALRDAEGRITGAINIFQDISERRRAQQALAGSEARLRSVLEGIPQLVWQSDDAGRWVRASSQWRTFTGQSEIESEGMGWLNAVHPDDRDRTICAWREATSQGQLDVEHRIRRASDGAYLWHHTRSLRVRKGIDASVEWLGTCTDIEDLKRAEAALSESEQRFRLYVQNVQEYALLQTDFEGRVTSWNPGAERLFGFKSTEVLGRDFARLTGTDEDKKKRLNDEISRVRQGERQEDAQWLRRKDGSRFWARWVSEPVYNDAGGLVGLAKVMRDETEREAVQAALRNSLAEKEELLKEVHHRVKNNLQVITSLLNLQARQITEPAVLTLFDESRNRVQSIASIHELMYRSDSFSTIMLAAYARQIVPSLIQFYGLHETVEVTISGEEVFLELERAVPYGLLLNELVSNACKHAFSSGKSGKLTINFEHHEGDIQVTVKDNGSGLPAGFDYGCATTLGLHLVRNLTRQLRGTLEIESVNGTAIRVRFPDAQAVVERKD